MVQAKRRNEPLGLEELDAGQYLIQALNDVGLFEPTQGGGWLPVSWITLHNYSKATGEISETWEFRALREMSSAYATGFTEGINPFCKHPDLWDEEE